MSTRVYSAHMNRLMATSVLMFAALLGRHAGAQSGGGIITGYVRDSLGTAVGFAEVAVVGSDISTFADAQGRFRLSHVPYGQVDLRVRRLGYKPSISTVVFPSGTEPEVELRVVAIPGDLPAYEILAKREVYDARLAGFKERRAKGVGHFITRERLERFHSNRFADVLREVPGVRLRPMRGGGTSITLRGASCAPLVFVDGVPASAGTVDLEMFDLSTVEGIEIYSGLASIPPEFVTGRGGERCGVVAIWSRPFRPKARASVPASKRSQELESLISSMTVYTADDVDTPASLIAGTASPEYPDSLRLEGRSGRVVVRLVVNVDGTFDPETVTLISSTDSLFTNAVEQALSGAKFRAATLKGRPVRQVLQLPFVFRIDSASAVKR